MCNAVAPTEKQLHKHSSLRASPVAANRDEYTTAAVDTRLIIQAKPLGGKEKNSERT
jgi:hypothetical protein